MFRTIKQKTSQQGLWRAWVCVWSLALACLVYTACSHMQYLHLASEKQFENHTKRWFDNDPDGPKDHVTGILKLMSHDTNSNNRSINDTVITNQRYPERQPLFLTLEGLHYGRLGNQMFMYASLLGIAHTLNRTPFISPGFSLDVAFQLGHVAEIPESETWPIAEQIHYATFERTLLDKLLSDHLQHQNLTLSGFLQSWKYFQNITEIIRTEFLFRTSVLRQKNQILLSVLPLPRQEVILVGVHVRRSDLLSSKNIAMGYTVPDTSYFMKAFQWMRSKFVGEKVVFLVTSDDFTWCENHLRGNDVVFMPPASHPVHLALLSGCDHVIFSTGTFGWWGAWLAGGYVVYYKKYPGYGTNLSKGFSRHDFFPRHWVGLGD